MILSFERSSHAELIQCDAFYGARHTTSSFCCRPCFELVLLLFGRSEFIVQQLGIRVVFEPITRETIENHSDLHFPNGDHLREATQELGRRLPAVDVGPRADFGALNQLFGASLAWTASARGAILLPPLSRASPEHPSQLPFVKSVTAPSIGYRKGKPIVSEDMQSIQGWRQTFSAMFRFG